jgi:precorrin-6A/cobalt-precorrin-6A reductase
MTRTVLVLGGTAEARELAAALHGRPDTRVISTLAGRVARPRLPEGEVRVGGFGGADGLAAYLEQEDVDAVVDATHPFAERISASAARACARASVPLLRVAREPFRAKPGDDWRRVATLEEAAALIPGAGRRVFLTTGRQGLAAFAGVGAGEAFFLVRCVDPPEPPLPADHVVLLDRGPFTLEGELALIDEHRLDVLVTKDSGGPHTAAKLEAARARHLAVIVISRPPRPDGPAVTSVGQALEWLDRPAHDG